MRLYKSESAHNLCLAVALFVASMATQDSHAQEINPPASSAVVLIIDASGSMWEELDGGYKIRMAQGALKRVASELSDDTHIGLVAYGHRRERDCSDIQTLVPLGSIDRAALNREVDALNPVGRTPITASIREAIDMLAEHDGPASVVLVSDGLETCGGDPCQLVRDTRASGVNVVMHVVGFGVGEVDTSQLECTAQAGGGQYINASDAEELAAALRTTVEEPPFVGGWLSIMTTRDGELMDATVNVMPSGGGEEAGRGRTYTSSESNPGVFPLRAGSYDVRVGAIGVEGDIRRMLEGVQIITGETVEHVVDFSVGELSVGLTRNGEPSRVGIRVYNAGTNTEVAVGVAYASSSSNPQVFTMTAGTYDVLLKPAGVAGAEGELLRGITVEPGERAEVAHTIASGTLRVKVTNDGELAAAALYVVTLDGNREVARGRTSADDNTNPRVFELVPGRYKVRVRGLRIEGDPQSEFEIVISGASGVERSVDLKNAQR